MSVQLDLGAWIEVNGVWREFEEPGIYDLAPEGHGAEEQTYRVREHKSDYFDGTFHSHRVKESLNKVTTVRVIGSDYVDLHIKLEQLVSWWQQDESFRVRFRYENFQETYTDCDLISTRIERTHELLHSIRAVVTFNWTARGREWEEVL